MVLVKPTEPQSTIYEEADRLHIRIPAKRLWLQLFFLGFWLSAWIVGETLAGLTLAFGPLVPGQPPPSAFLAFWFAGWTAAGAFVGAVFSWKLAGIELVSFNEDTLTLRKEVLGIGRGWTYERGEIRDMRMQRVVFRWFSVGIGGSSVAFNYDRQTVCFGEGLYEAETKMLVSEIVRRFPDLAPMGRPPQRRLP